jgi:tetratricopeptide (TPR) repeat protein
MNQNQSRGSSSIAWFKLANLIEKREKEKALSVFRLFTHSLRDKAYSLQLEGDMLWSLDDMGLAEEKYANAAFLYQKEKRWVHAVSLYESLIVNNPENYQFLTGIILCYGQLGWETKFKEKLDSICELFIKNISDEHLFTSAIKLLVDVARALENEEMKAVLYNKIQILLSSLPKAAAEKVEYMFKATKK